MQSNFAKQQLEFVDFVSYIVSLNFVISRFTWHAIIVAFSIVAGLPIVAKFGNNQLCVYIKVLPNVTFPTSIG